MTTTLEPISNLPPPCGPRGCATSRACGAPLAVVIEGRAYCATHGQRMLDALCGRRVYRDNAPTNGRVCPIRPS